MSRIRIAALLGLVLAVAGCSGSEDGPSLYRVSGEVTYDGKPIENGTILFRNTGSDGRAYQGEIKNGKYDLKSEAGSMRVEITGSRVIPGKFKEVNPGEKDPVSEMYVPAKYNSKTTLEAKVEEKSNEIPFNLPK